MPELPDLTAYLEALEKRVGGEVLERLRFISPFVLRSVKPAAGELEGRRVVGLRRLGKRIVVELEGEFFVVVHLMVAGRLQFAPRSAAAGEVKRGRAANAAGARNRLAAVDFSSGTLTLTEAGTKRRASIHLVAGESDLARHDPGGIEPLAADPEAFRRSLAAENHTLKRALTDPHRVAGIGNAYSDEILFAARLSPFARTADLSDDGWGRLYAATQKTLEDWVTLLRREFAGRFPDKVTAFRPAMMVHGRYGLPCPVCATPVQRIVYAENEANYCPTCQTGGRLLADRVLSRLLRADWPKSLEELEERKSLARGLRTGLQASLLTLALLPGVAGAFPGSSEPPLGRAVEPPLPVPSLRPDPVRLDQARALLAVRRAGSPAGAESAELGGLWLGGYRCWTDIDDPLLLDRAAQVIGELEATYLQRYGRRPIGTPAEAIVLFSSESDYRLFQSGDRRLAGVTVSTGLAGSGLVATYRGKRSDDEFLGTLVHEIGHLLNRRALGPSLPSWLDEGLADDLGASRIDSRGHLLPGSWSRTLDAHGSEIRISGGEAALRDLAERLDATDGGSQSMDLGAVLALDWEEFVAEESAEWNYAAAAAFIRMLLADPTAGELFRDWLAEVSRGASPEAEELRRVLGRPWEELDRQLALWVQKEFAQLPALRPPVLEGAVPVAR